jgi:hypothetical protein
MEWGGLLQGFLNKFCKIRNIVMCPSTSSFQAQKDKERG